MIAKLSQLRKCLFSSDVFFADATINAEAPNVTKCVISRAL